MSSINRDVARIRVAITKALRPSKPSRDAAFDLFSTASLQIYSAGLVAYLYFLGWMFLYYYLLSFGIDIFSLDIPFHYFFVYSFATISFAWSKWWWSICLLGVAAPTMVVWSHVLYASRAQAGSPALQSVAAGILLIGLIGGVFFLGHFGAKHAGEARYKDLRFAASHSYEFDFRPKVKLSTNSYVSALLEFDPSRRAIPIIETADRIYVLVQQVEPSEDRNYRRAARVIEISRSDVLFVKVKIPDARLSPEEETDLWRD